jgi:probable pyridine nucleotide-disulfide oxidoreductase
MLIDAHSERILGFTVLVTRQELLVTVQTAMLGELPYTALRDAIFTHPTTAEGLNVLLASVPVKATRQSA